MSSTSSVPPQGYRPPSPSTQDYRHLSLSTPSSSGSQDDEKTAPSSSSEDRFHAADVATQRPFTSQRTGPAPQPPIPSPSPRASAASQAVNDTNESASVDSFPFFVDEKDYTFSPSKEVAEKNFTFSPSQGKDTATLVIRFPGEMTRRTFYIRINHDVVSGTEDQQGEAFARLLQLAFVADPTFTQATFSTAGRDNAGRGDNTLTVKGASGRAQTFGPHEVDFRYLRSLGDKVFAPTLLAQMRQADEAKFKYKDLIEELVIALKRRNVAHATAADAQEITFNQKRDDVEDEDLEPADDAQESSSNASQPQNGSESAASAPSVSVAAPGPTPPASSAVGHRLPDGGFYLGRPGAPLPSFLRNGRVPRSPTPTPSTSQPQNGPEKPSSAPSASVAASVAASGPTPPASSAVLHRLPDGGFYLGRPGAPLPSFLQSGRMPLSPTPTPSTLSPRGRPPTPIVVPSTPTSTIVPSTPASQAAPEATPASQGASITSPPTPQAAAEPTLPAAVSGVPQD